MVFSHGFGCDQHMWRHVWPAFEDDHRIVLFDHMGYGGSDLSAYDPARYDSLQGYADDVVELLTELDLRDVVFVGHSVAAMIGVLAANEVPDRFDRLVLIGPSPRYLDDDGYVGGFSQEDIDGLLASLESNYLGWSGAMAPAIMGNADRPELGEELTNSFCRTDPEIAVSLRSRDVPLRQPRRSRARQDSGARHAVLAGRDRPRGGRAVRASAAPGERVRPPGGNGPLPQPQRAA